MKYDVYVDGKFVGVVEGQNAIEATTEAKTKFIDEEGGKSDDKRIYMRAWG